MPLTKSIMIVSLLLDTLRKNVSHLFMMSTLKDLDYHLIIIIRVSQLETLTHGSISAKMSSDIRHCLIKVKVMAQLQIFLHLPQYKLLGPISQLWNRIGSNNLLSLHLILVYNIYKYCHT